MILYGTIAFQNLFFILVALKVLGNLHNIQGDQNVSLHLMITIQKVTSNVQLVPHGCTWLSLAVWQRTARSRRTQLTLTPSVIPDSNYVIMVSD
jgi:hypothetical protein